MDAEQLRGEIAAIVDKHAIGLLKSLREIKQWVGNNDDLELAVTREKLISLSQDIVVHYSEVLRKG